MRLWMMVSVALLLGSNEAGAQPLARTFGFTNQFEFLPSPNLLLASDGLLYGAANSGGVSNFGCLFRLNTNGNTYAALHYFNGADGASPEAGLLEGSDGFLYGTTYAGGPSNVGGIFRLNKTGGSFTVLKHFTGVGGDGANPSATLLEATNGLLYGTTSFGGTSSNGIVFQISKAGTGYTVLKSFVFTNGANPSVALVQASTGRLYGTTDSGGTRTNGVVFGLNLDGSGFTNLWHFSGGTNDGANPYSSLMEGDDGVLYGTTYLGGTTNAGTVYKLNQDGSGYAVLHSFMGRLNGDAENPGAELNLASDGALYGTTVAGGTNDAGTIFKLNTNGGSYAIVRHFAGGSEGRYPQSTLLESAAGVIYGTTSAGGNGEGGTIFKLNKDASGFVTVKSFYAFAGGDGFYPADAVLAGNDGKIYGNTVKGGAYVSGTIFRMNADGEGYQLLHHFGDGAADGTDPRGGLLQGLDGGLYGATYAGGISNAGTVYRLNTYGSGYAVLLNFGSTTNDARNPFGGLMQSADGFLYGTTVFGGTNQAGTIFRVATNGTGYTVLRSLGGAANSPTNPYCRLVESPAGTFYGTTADGGTNSAGTVFRINQDGSGFAVLRSFSKDANGWRPFTGVIRGSDELLYGTTYVTSTSGAGTIYRMATNGTGFTVLSTLSLATNGGSQSSLMEAADGTLYGSACGNGSLGYGGVFKLNKDGTGFAPARIFGPASINGLYPKAALMQIADGTLYGCTVGGGVGWGTVFVFPGLPPLIGNHPQALVLSSGESATLSITAGQWPMSYQWFFNGVAVSQATNSFLPLSPLSLAQAGNYQVIISNSVGSVTSIVASVTAFDSNWASNQFQFNIGGPVGAGYRIDFRDDLTSSWSALTNFSLVSSPFQISDPDSAAQLQRFYRLVKLP